MKRVFICSPLRPTSEFSTDDNIGLAKNLCNAACRAGYAPFAPHIFYTLFLDELKPEDRELGIDCGLEWLLAVDELWAYAPDYKSSSMGMRKEIVLAGTMGIPVTYMPASWAAVPPRGSTPTEPRPTHLLEAEPVAPLAERQELEALLAECRVFLKEVANSHWRREAWRLMNQIDNFVPAQEG